MREIKFRAFDKENKKMFKVARFDFSDYTIYSHLFACDGYLGESCEIMQYTGLKDKNGVEIYEGDILESGTVRMKVVFEEFAFKLIRLDAFAPNKHLVHNMIMAKQTVCFVIGNIFENPELLEETP